MTHASINKSHDRPNTIVSHVDVNILNFASDTGYLNLIYLIFAKN